MVDGKDEWIVIGISGVTCGGKTTLANKLSGALAPVRVFHQDPYFYPDDSARHVRCEGLDHNNYDILSSLDMPRMHADITRALAGHAAGHDAGHDAGHAGQKAGRLRVEGKGFLVVEGFTALNYAPIRELCHLSYYFVLEYGECASRRAHRLYEPPDVPGYFEQCVWPEHIRYRAEIENDPHVRIVDGMRPDVFETVIEDLKALGATEVP